ncbi:type VI secretion system baseplate subunit TssK [Gallaecimonas kandeliae]|uniref:type VI secretion system baseplate subunit TssK n=1 Tax=Gallaecimonas kandeliae TaxID=3029055 RepID=UPI002648A9FF|nr:type VI secretion system baseplate subunit TssK [Gallaecimonas kandeliae]WKE65747.1 type VI secretion system baseplate subunit TssK [Gallaecimonas kandeliae]
MERLAKVAWSEGMLLRPQHFQQQDRFLYQVSNKRHVKLNPHGYGITELMLDEQALGLGQVNLVRAAGLFPDGMPFSFDQQESLSLSIPADARDELLYLALPLEKQAGVNIADRDSAQIARYVLQDVSVMDDSLEDGLEEDLGLAYLNPCLRLEREDKAGFVSLPIARIVEVLNEQEVKLDRSFIAPCLDMGAVQPLANLLRELLAMVKQRAGALAMRMQKGNEQASTLLDVLMLQALNRWQPLLEHLKESKGVHPERGYELLITLAGEMATFTRAEKRPPQLPGYRHDNLTATFGDLAAVLSQSLSTVLEQTAVALKLEEAQFGIKVAPLADKSLLEAAQLVLAVKADLTTEEIRRRLPAQIKLGAVEHIRDLVNNHLPGIAVSALPVAPRQIPYHAGYHYFLLDSHSDRWQQLRQSGGLAVHVSGHYPGLALELWAIRQ